MWPKDPTERCPRLSPQPRSPDEGGNHRSSEALRGNQSPQPRSPDEGGNHRSSEALRGNQRPSGRHSEAIRGNQTHHIMCTQRHSPCEGRDRIAWPGSCMPPRRPRTASEASGDAVSARGVTPCGTRVRASPSAPACNEGGNQSHTALEAGQAHRHLHAISKQSRRMSRPSEGVLSGNRRQS